jgi:hypothetical protein
MKSLEKITGVLLLCAIVSCRKNELEKISGPENSNTVLTEQNKLSESDWTPITQSNTADRPTHTVYYTNLQAGNITSANADNALVRIYKKDNSGKISSTALPFEENIGSQKLYWYYEVSEGNIMVSVDVYGSKVNPFTNNSFKYIIVDNAAVEGMERKGISKKQLLQMPYEDLNKLK